MIAFIKNFKTKHSEAYDLITRALWTFVQAFLGSLIIMPSMDKKALYSAIIGAVGAGISAVKTLIVAYAEKQLDKKQMEDEGDA